MDILIRSLVIFLFLWLVVRVGGKREVAQLSAFDMILLITVGDLVSQGIVQEDYSVTAAVIAVTTFNAGLLNAMSFRYPRFRPWLAGRARIVVRNGEPLLETLAGERMTNPGRPRGRSRSTRASGGSATSTCACWRPMGPSPSSPATRTGATGPRGRRTSCRHQRHLSSPAAWVPVRAASFEFLRATQEDLDRRPVFQPNELLAVTSTLERWTTPVNSST